jgi:hypothetical protein
MKNIFGRNKSIKFTTVYLLTFFLLYFSAHNFYHNSFDHDHSNSCSICVLEKFSVSDVPSAIIIAPIIVVKDCICFQCKSDFHKTLKTYCSRAPPSPYSLS